jgi:CHAD domain-containing protein
MLDRPTGKVAAAMLSRVAHKVKGRLEDLDLDRRESLHSLRKSAKKLRYSLEYFPGLQGRKGETYHKRCDTLQKRLGRINDLDNLVRLAGELTAGDRLDLAPALGVLGERSTALIADEMKGPRRTLRKFPRKAAF